MSIEKLDDTAIAEALRAQIELLHRNLRHANENGLQFKLENIASIGRPDFAYQDALKLWRNY